MKEFTVLFRKGFIKGLRNTKQNPRPEEALVESQGAIPEFGVTRAIEDIRTNQLPNAGVSFTFPYPQIFTLTYVTVVCGRTTIYEQVGGALVPVIQGLTPGSTWTIADYGRYIILTNGPVLVTRDADSGEWTTFSDCSIPNCLCLCDINGQLLIGAPECTVPADFRGV